MEGHPPSVIQTFVAYLWTLYIPSFILALSDGVIIPVLPLYARSMAGGIDDFIAGAVVSGRPFGQMLSDIPCGVVTERLGINASVLTGCAVMTLGALVATVCRSVWVLLAAQVVVGLGFSLFGVARHGLVGDVDVRIRGRAVAIMGGLARGGWTLGPLAGGYLAHHLGMRFPFALTTFLLLLAGFMLAFTSFRGASSGGRSPGEHCLSLRTGLARLWTGDGLRDKHGSSSGELLPAALHEPNMGGPGSSAHAGGRLQKLRSSKKARSSYALLSTSDDEGGVYSGGCDKDGHDGTRGAAPPATAGFGFKLFPRWAKTRPAVVEHHDDDDGGGEDRDGGGGDGYAGGGGVRELDSRQFVGWDAFPDYGDLDDGDLAAVSPPPAAFSGVTVQDGTGTGGDHGSHVGDVSISVPGGGRSASLPVSTGGTTAGGGEIALAAKKGMAMGRPSTGRKGMVAMGRQNKGIVQPEEEITEFEEGVVREGGAIRGYDGDDDWDGSDGEEPPPGLVSTLRTHRREFLYGSMVLALQCLRQSRNFLLPLVATDALGLTKSQVGLVTALSFGVDTLLFYPSGYCMDRYGRKPTGIASMSILSTGIALLGFAKAVPMAVLAAVTIGVGNGLSGGMMITMGADFAPSGQGRAIFLGVWRFLASTGSMLGPFLAGIVARHLSLGWACWFIGAVGYMATVLWVLFVPESKRHGQK
eukprot:jgi/Mesvir1/5346/Mv15435-RA.1